MTGSFQQQALNAPYYPMQTASTQGVWNVYGSSSAPSSTGYNYSFPNIKPPLTPQEEASKAYSDMYDMLRKVAEEMGKFPLIHGRHYPDRAASRRLLRLFPLLARIAGMMPGPTFPEVDEEAKKRQEATDLQAFLKYAYPKRYYSGTTTTTAYDSSSWDSNTTSSTSFSGTSFKAFVDRIKNKFLSL